MFNKDKYMDPESAAIVDSVINREFTDVEEPSDSLQRTGYDDDLYNGSDLGFYDLHSAKHVVDQEKFILENPDRYPDANLEDVAAMRKYHVSKLNEKLWRSHLETTANEEVRAKIDARLGEIASELANASVGKKIREFVKPDAERTRERVELTIRQAHLKSRQKAIGGVEWSNGQAKKIAERHGDILYEEALDSAEEAGVDIVNSNRTRA